MALICETKLAYLLIVPENESDAVIRQIPEFIMETGTLVMFSLLVAIFAGLSWFILINKAQKIEIAETEYLFE
jgi:hypothetical protein